jgi:ankyrin repeat protein
MVPLHWAAIKGHHECVQMLAAAGADPHVADPNGMVPLHWAACNGHHECVQMLIAAGTSPNVADTREMTPLHWAAIKGCSKKFETISKRDCNAIDSYRAM